MVPPWINDLPALAHVPAPLVLLALLALSLVTIFAGRTVVKLAVFLLAGFAGAALGASLTIHYLSPAIGIIGLLLGFLIGGVLGLMLLPVGVGLAVGYAAYLVALDFASGHVVALFAGVAFFVAGAVLASKILGAATAVLGGLLLFNVLLMYGFTGFLSLAASALLTIVGLWVQLDQHRRAPVAPPPESQPR